MSIVRVSNHLDDLVADAERSSTVPARRLRDAVSDSLEDGNRFAKASASEQHTMFGDTDIEYAPSFTSEVTGQFRGEYGSDHAIGDGTQATGYEYGSRNSPPTMTTTSRSTTSSQCSARRSHGWLRRCLLATDARLDTRQHVRALRDALKVTLGITTVYEWGQVPGESGNAGSLPPMWALVSLQRGQSADLRVSAEAGSTLWRVTVGVVGSTPDEVRWLLYKTAIALNEESLTIGDTTTSPLQHESERVATRDEGRYYSAVVYTYAL